MNLKQETAVARVQIDELRGDSVPGAEDCPAGGTGYRIHVREGDLLC